MRQFLGEYLFDTNCFYSIGRKQNKIEAINELDYKITTASVAISEIQRIDDNISIRKFQGRKAAMYALDQVTDEIYVTPDYTVLPRAFGQKYDKNIKYPRQSISHFLNANVPSEIDQSINKNLKNWKLDWPEYFPKHYRQIINEPPYPEDELRRGLITAYACQAGLFSKETYSEARQNQSSFAQLQELAINKYNGELDILIDFIIKMAFVNYGNKKIDKNRLFDLEFFFHMRPNDSEQLFVTTEIDLIEIFRMVDKKRIINFNELLPE